jgi:hypothetical protein
MRVICPLCQKTITIADSLAGQTATCPECSGTLTAPTMMTPPPASAVTVTTAAPPTASVPPSAVSPEHTPPPISPTLQESGAGGRGTRFQLSERVLQWIGPAALFVLFFSTFFTWVGSYAGSYPVYTQSAWGAGFGVFATDPVGDEVLKAEADLKKAAGASPAMIFSLLLLIFILPIALLDFAKDHFHFSVPDALQIVWPHRLTIVLVGSALIFVLLSLQLIGGIGLENTARAMAEARVTPTTPDATEPTTKTTTERDLRKFVEVNRLGLKRTTALCIGFWAAFAAVAGFGLESWMHRRAGRRAPAIELQW